MSGRAVRIEALIEGSARFLDRPHRVAGLKAQPASEKAGLDIPPPSWPVIAKSESAAEVSGAKRLEASPSLPEAPLRDPLR